MLSKLIREVRPGESIVIETEDYRTLMRTVGSYITREQIPSVQYKKVLIVDPETLSTVEGVRVTRTKEA